MSLSAVLTALNEYVGDVLVNDCGRPVPSRVLRYFGQDGIPQDCCTAAGVLSTSFHDGYPSKSFPGSGASTPDQCGLRPVYLLQVRYDVCWPIPKDPAKITPAEYDAFDETAAMLSDVADCVARALMRLACAGAEHGARAELVTALKQHCRDFAYRDVLPSTRPLGGCARLTWSVWSGVRRDATPES